MKCPKCGYLGFETTDRCRNCQYDFSLAPFSTEQELTLHNTSKTESSNDFDLPPIQRQSDRLSTSALDLDRLFGDAETQRALTSEPVTRAVEPTIALVDEDADTAAPLELPKEEPVTDGPPLMAIAEVHDSPESPGDGSALPFDDGPILPPPAARPPLSVRRSTPDVPRNRPRTTRTARPDSILNLESVSASSIARDTSETIKSLLESPSLGVRMSAGLIDLALLVGIDAAILYLTLKVTGLQSTLEDLRVLPPVPFVGFLALLAFGYVAAFTVAGGQTIGKMVLSLRVIGDDGRPIDAAGGMLRALGCMLVPATLGLSYLPALFTSDHRAIHDRLAGTRVVQE